jgi:glycerol uptake facilitator protein
LEAGSVQAGGADFLTGEIPERGVAAYLAEFLGTLTLVFFITMVVSEFIQAPTATAPGVTPTQPFIDWAVIGLVHVLALFLIVQTIALVSGAHVNPAITVGLAAIRQIRPIDASIYVVMQLLGGTVGALITKGLLTTEGKDVHFGAVDVSAVISHHTFTGMCVEALGTFFLVWAVVGVAVNPTAFKSWAGLVIGGTLGLIVMIGGSLTGGSFNPARAFGPALVSGFWSSKTAGAWILIWVLAPLVGAVAAAVSYLYLFLLPGKKGPFGMRPVG